MTERTGRQRPGGRTERTRTAVHAATRELLAESGGALPRMADVAERSGVHLATIYRRWRTVRALVLDLAVDDINEREPVAATGDLRGDLLAYARQFAAGVATPAGLGFLRTLIDAAAAPENDLEQTLTLMDRRLDRYQRLLDAAGSTALTPMDIVENLLAPVYLRALLSAPLAADGPDIERLIDNLLAIDAARLAQDQSKDMPRRSESAALKGR